VTSTRQDNAGKVISAHATPAVPREGATIQVEPGAQLFYNQEFPGRSGDSQNV